MKTIEHITYNVDFAVAAYWEGFKVYVGHPDAQDEDVRMSSQKEIEEADGHMFIINLSK